MEGNGSLEALNDQRFVGLPEKRSFLKIKEFAEYIGTSVEMVRFHIKRGKIKTHPDPLVPNRKVIPISELRRAFATTSNAIVPYFGRQYPHMFYIFFLACSFGKDLRTIKKELKNAELMVPPNEELKKITEAVFETAPDEVKKLYRRKKQHFMVPEFDKWIEDLKFQEIYEDAVGYVPAMIMQNRRIRFLIELMSSADFIAAEISDSISMLTDLHVEPGVISNYCLMYYYVRQMPTEDWIQYLNDLGRVDQYGAALRNECIDNKIAVIRNLKIRVEIDRVEECNDAFIKAKYMFNRMAESNNHQKHIDSAVQLRSMSVMDNVIRANLRDTRDQVASKREAREQAGGMVNAKEKEAEDNDPLLEDIIPDEKEDQDAATGS